MAQLIILFILFVGFWLFVIVPQQRRVRAHRAFIGRLEVGDEVITSSGIFGTVTWLETETVGLQIAPGTEITVARLAIGRSQPGTGIESGEEPGDDLIGRGDVVSDADADATDDDRE